MTSGEITGIVAVLGSILTMLGISGLDPALLTNAVNGILAVVTVVATIWTLYKHKKAVSALK